MDPFTQGLVGATATQVFAKRRDVAAAALLGWFSGMAADLDVLIKSDTDPLLALEYHRQFTHSLIFIPVGGLLCAAVMYLLWSRNRFSFKQTYLFCLLGYATHAVLDACTTYGTLLLWPFSNARVAWNSVSVVDPLFTLPLLLWLLFAIARRSRGWAWIAVVYAFSYLGLGVVQNQRALQVATAIAASRGHQPVELGVKPSFANIIVWKSVYEYQGKYYVDAIRVATQPSVYTGSSTEKLDLNKHFSWLDLSSQQAVDVERFRWFSNDYLGIDPGNPERIIDIRYSLIPNQLTGMWGIQLQRDAPSTMHARYTVNRPRGAAINPSVQQLWQMIVGDYAAVSLKSHTLSAQ